MHHDHDHSLSLINNAQFLFSIVFYLKTNQMASINDLAAAAIAAGARQSSIASGDAEAPAQSTNSSGAVRGALVVLEGLDRSGKTTQVKLLQQRFVEVGRPVKVMRFPGAFASRGLSRVLTLGR